MVKIYENIEKKYNTLVIDPPWDIKIQTSSCYNKRRPDRRKELPYKTMTLKEIKDFPIHEFANQGSHIYLWTTNSFLRKAFEVFDSWDVKFHLIMVYCKPSFLAPMMSYQFATEFCLLGFYGKPMQKFINKGVRLNWIKANPKRNHSSKPDEFYNLIRYMSPEPRIDIFSRRIIAGFDNWGDESINEKQEVLTTVRGL